MKIEDTARAIQEALGLDTYQAKSLIDALDARYRRVPAGETEALIAQYKTTLESKPRLATPPPPLDERIFLARLEGKWQIGQVVDWGGHPHRVGKCADGGPQCLACDRIGFHVERIEEPALVPSGATIPSPPPSAPSLGRLAEDENFTDEVAGRLAELGLDIERKKS